MTSTELRRIVGAMTARPWVSGYSDILKVGPRCPRSVAQNLTRDDNEALRVLANHADALVALVEACEREADVLSSFARRNGAAYPNTAAAIGVVLDALARVSDVKIT